MHAAAAREAVVPDCGDTVVNRDGLCLAAIVEHVVVNVGQPPRDSDSFDAATTVECTPAFRMR